MGESVFEDAVRLRPGADPVWPLLLLTGCGLLTVFFYYPLATVVLAALRLPTESDPGFFWRVAGFTYGQAFLSALCSAALGVPGALLFARSRGRWREIWAALSLVPFSLPPILVALGLLGIWGRQGPLGLLMGESYVGIYGWFGILMAHTLFNFPLFVRLVGQALQQGDHAEEKVALSLGAPRWRCFVWVTWPKIRGAFSSAFVLAFLFSAASFLVVLLLGGGPAFTSIEVAVYQAIKQDFDPGLAVRLAGLQMLVAGVLSVGLYRTPVSTVHTHQHDPALYRFRGAIAQKLFQIFYVGLVLSFVGLPLAWILVRGVPQWSQLEGIGETLAVSLRLACAAAFLSTAFSLVIGYAAYRSGRKRWRTFVSLVCTLPLAISSLLLLLGWRLAYPSWLEAATGVWWAVVAVQGLAALPVVYRPVKESFSRIPSEWEKLARSLGAGAWQRWRWVQWPVLRPGVALAFLFGALIALGEAGAVLLFQDESTMNLTYRIYQSMGRYRFDQAYAMASVLLLLSVGLGALVAHGEREPAP